METHLDYPPALSESGFTALAAPLEGETIRLVPLAQHHAAQLHAAFEDDDLWGISLVRRPRPADFAGTQEWIADALDAVRAQTQAAFVIETHAGELAGTTRYLDIRWHDGGVEIGFTMVFAPFRRTRVNTEAKYLLMRRAFDDLGFARVALKTDARNTRSRTAIARIGAQYEGTFRCLQRRHSGEIRDTAMFSVTFREWPGVRSRFEERLG